MGEFENIITSTEERAREAGRVEGLAEGRVEGLTEGGHNKAKEIAANMLSAGMSIEQVAQFTGLEISEVEKLSL
jgi:predicted transposase/invertase (TIGR01784 family)